jgi:hypothetical protein
MSAIVKIGPEAYPPRFQPNATECELSRFTLYAKYFAEAVKAIRNYSEIFRRTCDVGSQRK